MQLKNKAHTSCLDESGSISHYSILLHRLHRCSPIGTCDAVKDSKSVSSKSEYTKTVGLSDIIFIGTVL